tara:strand:- start:300 stop:515 length:216 start_codon:yes stop_codon:yes gene_type:complete
MSPAPNFTSSPQSGVTVNSPSSNKQVSFKKSRHNTLDWVEKQLRDVVTFDKGLSIHQNRKDRRSEPSQIQA